MRNSVSPFSLFLILLGTRLDPPKSFATPQSRLVARQEMKEWIKKNNVTEYDEDEDNNHVLMPEQPDHTEDDALKFTGRLFGGLVLDVKRKLPWFASDFKDALHIQTLASIIYIYLGKRLLPFNTFIMS